VPIDEATGEWSQETFNAIKEKLDSRLRQRIADTNSLRNFDHTRFAFKECLTVAVAEIKPISENSGVNTSVFYLEKQQLWTENPVLDYGKDGVKYFYIDVNRHLQVIHINQKVLRNISKENKKLSAR